MIWELLLKDTINWHETKNVVLRCCPGDWRNGDRIKFVAPRGTSKSSVLAYLKIHLVPYLVPCLPKPFPRQRWMGAKLACSQVAPLCMINDIGTTAYRIFMEKFHGALSPAQQSDPNPAQLAIADISAHEAPAAPTNNSGDGAGIDWAKENFIRIQKSFGFFH